MKKIILLSIILIRFASGQNVMIYGMKQENPITKKLYEFPDIIVINSKIVQIKINTELRKDILLADSGTPVDHIFDNVWTTDSQSARLSNVSYKVFPNSKPIFSISISGEGCGAYCEPYTSYFTFNLNTGNKLSLDSIFTKQGMQLIHDSINVLKAKRIKTKLLQIEGLLKVRIDSAWKQQYMEELEMYKECLDKKIEPEWIPNLEFSFSQKKLIVYSDRCSAHYNMALDELMNFEYTFFPRRWIKYLTPYGKSIVRF